MTGFHWRWTLRGKIAAWSTAVLIAALVLYGAIVYVSLRQVLWQELDERLHHDIETLEGLLQPFWTADGFRPLPGQSPLDADDYRWFQVWSPGGALQFSSSAASAAPIAALARPHADRALSAQREDGTAIRIREEAGHIAGHPVVVRTVAPESGLHQEIVEFLWLVGLALPAVAIVAGIGGYFVVKRTLRAVDALVAGSTAISAERLDMRLPVVHPDDEVGQIAQALNATLARLEASFEQLRRFTANASHELRTPLTALRTTGQAMLSGEQRLESYREAVADMLEDAEHLSSVLDTMILLAQADAGTIPVDRRPTDLDALVAAVAKDCEVLATDKGQTLSVSCAAGTANVDAIVLRIAVANVLHNAIRYSPSSSAVAVRAFKAGLESVIEVQDDGPGIPKAHHAHLFERFYRVDPGRSREVGGVGLGLAMARWSINAHGGRIEVDSEIGVGSTFRLILPRELETSRSEPRRP